MLRDNLAGLIEPMVDRAGAHPLGGHHKAGRNGGCSRSTELAIVALKRSWRQIFGWKTEQPTEKAKWPGFAVTTAAHDSRAVGTAWHQSHRTIDPQCLKKSPPRRGGIYALTKNVALHFTLNQDKHISLSLDIPCRRHYPGRSDGTDSLSIAPSTSAFPTLQLGRLPH
jgi:hypothetical protein